MEPRENGAHDGENGTHGDEKRNSSFSCKNCNPK